MPFLKYNSPTHGWLIYELKKREVYIGRSPECDICLSEDKMASRKHSCLIAQHGGGYILKDCGSKNGTYVNGLPVETWQLKDGDVICVGSTYLTYKLQK